MGVIITGNLFIRIKISCSKLQWSILVSSTKYRYEELKQNSPVLRTTFATFAPFLKLSEIKFGVVWCYTFVFIVTVLHLCVYCDCVTPLCLLWLCYTFVFIVTVVHLCVYCDCVTPLCLLWLWYTCVSHVYLCLRNNWDTLQFSVS